MVETMRFSGFTDSEDFHIRTLLSMFADRKCWEFGVFWNEWRLDAYYIWYDGPIFGVHVGPLWFGLATH